MATTTIQIPAKVVSVAALGVPAGGVTCTPIIQKDSSGTSYYRDEAGVVITLGAAAPDGSETKINAGTNVTRTGAGTIVSPYVISAVTNAIEVAAAIAALPVGAAAVSGVTSVLGSDGQYHVLPASSATFTTQEEGVNLSTTVSALNFVGANITATGAGATTTVTVNVAPVTSTGVPATGPAAAPTNLNVRNLAVSVIGEVWEYLPAIGWRVVADPYAVASVAGTAAAPLGPFTAGAWVSGASVTAPRAGRVVIASHVQVQTPTASGGPQAIATGLNKNGTLIRQINVGTSGPAAGGVLTHASANEDLSTSWTGIVAAGDVFGTQGIGFSPFLMSTEIQLTYIG